MSIITARGQEAATNITKEKVDLKAAYIRLKENESVRVRVLGLTDYVEYKAHSSFEHKVYTQPCIAVMGECPLCVASKSGVEGFDSLYPKYRYLFAFADLDTGAIRFWDCSKGQAKKLLSDLAEYKDDINEIAFNFKRTGTKTETSFGLNPILKLKGDDVEKFAKFDGQEVTMDMFEAILQPKTPDLMKDVLNQAGFPMNDHFVGYVAPTEGTEEDSTKAF